MKLTGASACESRATAPLPEGQLVHDSLSEDGRIHGSALPMKGYTH
jgi:hypothetical protein